MKRKRETKIIRGVEYIRLEANLFTIGGKLKYFLNKDYKFFNVKLSVEYKGKTFTTYSDNFEKISRANVKAAIEQAYFRAMIKAFMRVDNLSYPEAKILADDPDAEKPALIDARIVARSLSPMDEYRKDLEEYGYATNLGGINK